MFISEKEIEWKLLSNGKFKELYQRAVGNNLIKTYGILFPEINVRFNVSYDNASFEPLLKEKFKLCAPYIDVPHLIFVHDYKQPKENTHYKHYGYLSQKMDKVIILASSFGMFKSTISGYASLCVQSQGYVPAHASVLSSNNVGLLLTGGSASGKTTTLLNLVDWLLKNNNTFRILTDDWAVIKQKDENYIAESFDPSISLRQNNLDENKHIRFFNHDYIQESVALQKKISLKPEYLYGCQIGAQIVVITAAIVLVPETGDNQLHPINKNDFAASVVDAAYHYPYVKTDQIISHKEFWVEFANQIPVFYFSTRGQGVPSQSIDAIKEYISG